MKLTSAQIQRVQDQTEAELIPDSLSVTRELKDAFGDHTFFLDNEGLHVVELVQQPGMEGQLGNVIKIASWASEQKDTLVPHDPQPTDVYVKVGANGPDPAA